MDHGRWTVDCGRWATDVARTVDCPAAKFTRHRRHNCQLHYVRQYIQNKIIKVKIKQWQKQQPRKKLQRAAKELANPKTKHCLLSLRRQLQLLVVPVQCQTKGRWWYNRKALFSFLELGWLPKKRHQIEAVSMVRDDVGKKKQKSGLGHVFLALRKNCASCQKGNRQINRCTKRLRTTQYIEI